MLLLRAAAPSLPKQDFDRTPSSLHDDPAMINEVVLCLEEGIVATPAEADITGLRSGLPSLPRRRCSAIWTLSVLDRYVAMADQHADLGPLYRVSDRCARWPAQGKTLPDCGKGDPFMKDVVIVDCIRTRMGPVQGSGAFRNVRAEDLSAHLMTSILLLRSLATLDPNEIEIIYWGCVQQTLEQGFNIARNAAPLGRYSEAGGAVTRQPPVRLQ